MASGNYDDDGFDHPSANNSPYLRNQQPSAAARQPQDESGFDGYYSTPPPQAGYFGLADHSSNQRNHHRGSSAGGVELEVLSNTSSNTRNNESKGDHRSDYSSQGGGQPDRPLISGEPLIQGVSEIAPPVPVATKVDEGKRLQRRANRNTHYDDEEAVVGTSSGYQSYQPPTRGRSLVRPERAVSDDAGYGSAGKQQVLTRNSEGGRARASTASARRRRKQQAMYTPPKRRCCASPWQTYCRVVTFYAPGRVLKCFGMPQKEVQKAWREKMGLVTIIILIMGCIAFLTFGFQQVLCGLSGKQTRIKWNEVGNGYVVVQGRAYDITKFQHEKATPWTGLENANLMGEPANAGGKDLSFLFQNPNSNCRGVLSYDQSLGDDSGNAVKVFPCVYINQTDAINPAQIPNDQGCHNTAAGRRALRNLPNTPIQYSWKDVHTQPNLVVFNGAVLDLARGQFLLEGVRMPDTMQNLINQGSMRGKDISLFLPSGDRKRVGRCMMDLFRVGSIDSSSLGCIAANIELYVSLIVILGGVFAKFFMAIYFGWFMGRRIGQIKEETPETRRERQAEIEAWADVNNHYGKEKLERKYTVLNTNKDNRKSRFFPTTSRYSHYMPGDEPGSRDKSRQNRQSRAIGSSAMPRQSAFFSDHRMSQYSQTQSMVFPNGPGDQLLPKTSGGLDVKALSMPPGPPVPVASPWNFDLAYTMLLVTCYSEGSHGIRTTLDSLCGTDYPTSHKCLFIICDGLIKGAGEDMYTPDVCLSMMTDFVIPPDRVQPYSYVSIAQGSKRHNMAKLYAGYYSPSENSPKNARENRVPMILVVKCGTPEEANESKPGNRGKRDSQIILMSFLQRVMFDERMTELEYELFNAMWNVTGVTPDNFEIVLMVDADTKVYVDSVTRMVKAMVDDPTIMGLCGETKIANKTDSWVTMIQVFEYYIAHHQAKAFESVFGGVTCLPGCFCMYRIKAPKGQHGYWVPILANPDIVENYSENVVDTLHRKNLLLLGEDRYLTTLMLRTFPKRKMMFVPSAVCKTIVPDEFKILLSQRRRWINSTVHNLAELVLVNDLCGTFCLSMQFMIFMDLVGTLALPAAIVFTLYVIVISTFTRPVPWLPLALLAVILGLPAVLIGLTSRKLVYIGWMLIYLVSLPIWNFVLPTYAYWHFDDFSWGQTRMVQGEGKDTGHGSGDGEFDSSQIVMKRWCDFEADKRRKTQMILGSVPSLAALAMTNSSDPSVNARGSRVISMRPSSVMSPQITTTSTNQTADSSEQLISTVGPAAQLQQAASQIADSEAQAAAGSIERLGYMTPNIIPVLASQGMSARNSTSQLPTSPGIYSNQYNMSRNASFSPENNAQFYAGSSGNTSSVHFAQGAMPQGPGSNVSSNHDESSTSLPSVKKQ